jgi:endonuclease YncB( thermonuclease family)
MADLPACLGETAEARAVTAEDPRTIELEDGRALRLAGIESFALLLESGDDAEAALQRRLQALLAGAPLRLRLIDEGADRYGRFPALIATGDRLVQESLAREGVALAFETGAALPCFAEMLAAENEARDAGRGFWAGAVLPEAEPEAIATRLGRFAVFEGTVISVGNRRARTYLNFGERWADDVTVEIDAEDRERFGGEAGLAELAGRRVRVRGFLEERGGPAVRIRSPMQIETVPTGEPSVGEVVP